jgi:hypothetical protein
MFDVLPQNNWHVKSSMLGIDVKSIHDSDEQTASLGGSDIYEEGGPPISGKPEKAVELNGNGMKKRNVLRDRTMKDCHVADELPEERKKGKGVPF